MTIIGLLQQLAERDVIIEVRDDQLHIDAPRGAITPELRDTLATRKQEILHVFSSSCIETIPCPGDDCDSKVVLMNGQGYCPNHQMAITVVVM